jgi:hypothetical protein
VRRVRLGARTLALLCALSLAGCGTDSPPAAPTLQLPFTSSATSPVLFNSVEGVQVGTTGYYAFGMLNSGTADLVIQGVAYAGNAAMALQALQNPLPVTLPFNGELVVPLLCTPPAQEAYDGAVTVASNAANTPTATVYLSCVGVQ